MSNSDLDDYDEIFGNEPETTEDDQNTDIPTLVANIEEDTSIKARPIVLPEPLNRFYGSATIDEPHSNNSEADQLSRSIPNQMNLGDSTPSNPETNTISSTRCTSAGAIIPPAEVNDIAVHIR